jgi:hypothetical protein
MNKAAERVRSGTTRTGTASQPENQVADFLRHQASIGDARHRSERSNGDQLTMKKVAKGPSNSDTRNQFQPLRFLPCARPAFTRLNVNQPAPDVT